MLAPADTPLAWAARHSPDRISAVGVLAVRIRRYLTTNADPCLAALPGQDIHDIKEVQSHPIALMQCANFLNTLPGIKIVEHEDTALAAHDIAAKQLDGNALL